MPSSSSAVIRVVPRPCGHTRSTVPSTCQRNDGPATTSTGVFTAGTFAAFSTLYTPPAPNSAPSTVKMICTHSEVVIRSSAAAAMMTPPDTTTPTPSATSAFAAYR
jgi:hypothetical protein